MRMVQTIGALKKPGVPDQVKLVGRLAFRWCRCFVDDWSSGRVFCRQNSSNLCPYPRGRRTPIADEQDKLVVWLLSESVAEF